MALCLIKWFFHIIFKDLLQFCFSCMILSFWWISLYLLCIMRYSTKDWPTTSLTLAWDSHTVCEGHFTGITFFFFLNFLVINECFHGVAMLRSGNCRDSYKDHLYFINLCLPSPFAHHYLCVYVLWSTVILSALHSFIIGQWHRSDK